jgi:lipoprotein-anchoring transpeptidase ErfK/SrfK
MLQLLNLPAMRKYLFISAAIISLSMSGGPESEHADLSGMVNFLKEYLDIKYKGKSFSRYIYVAAKQQKLYLIDNNRVIASYPISTAKKGLGSQSGSNKTPTGLHLIREKVGDGVPTAGIIKEKTYTGQEATIIQATKHSNLDIITTRLFHLDGLEPGINKGGNVDSYSRAIMIHGTNEEGLIGKPASHGCVRMKNEDILHLFEQISTGTYVVILNN